MLRIHATNGDVLHYTSFTAKWKYVGGFDAACNYNEQELLLTLTLVNINLSLSLS